MHERAGSLYHSCICTSVPPPTAAAQPLSLRLGSQGGAEQLVSGAYSEETGVYGWRGDNGHGPATAGREETWTDIKIAVLLNSSLRFSYKAIWLIFPTVTCIRPEFVGVDGGCSGVSVPSCDEED